MNEIIVALIGSGVFGALVSTIGSLIGKVIDNKHSKESEIAQGIEDLKTEITTIKKDISTLSLAVGEVEAKDIRYRLLRFADEILHGNKHSHEHFLQIKQDVTDYENYCKNHPNFKNERANDSIKLIRKTYDDCVENKSFIQ